MGHSVNGGLPVLRRKRAKKYHANKLWHTRMRELAVAEGRLRFLLGKASSSYVFVDEGKEIIILTAKIKRLRKKLGL